MDSSARREKMAVNDENGAATREFITLITHRSSESTSSLSIATFTRV